MIVEFKLWLVANEIEIVERNPNKVKKYISRGPNVRNDKGKKVGYIKNKETFIGYDQGKKISLIGGGYVVKDHSEEYARRKILYQRKLILGQGS